MNHHTHIPLGRAVSAADRLSRNLARRRHPYGVAYLAQSPEVPPGWLQMVVTFGLKSQSFLVAPWGEMRRINGEWDLTDRFWRKK
jgi:hypothetical protein